MRRQDSLTRFAADTKVDPPEGRVSVTHQHTPARIHNKQRQEGWKGKNAFIFNKEIKLN
jgi:hypothetical protein